MDVSLGRQASPAPLSPLAAAAGASRNALASPPGPPWRLQTALFAALAGLGAKLIGTSAAQVRRRRRWLPRMLQGVAVPAARVSLRLALPPNPRVPAAPPGAPPESMQGAFVGALVAMSSTSIVVKVLTESRTQNSQPGQITIGTLILQARRAPGSA